MKKKISLLLIPCLAVLLPLAGAGAEKYSSSRPLKVGVIVPLTGENTTFGTSTRNGILMAYDSLPQAERDRIQLFFEDDAFNPKQAISAFQKLRAAQKIEALINGGSQSALAMAGLADENQIPFLAIASAPEIVAGKKFVMNFWVTPQTEAELLVPEALRRGYQRIARISSVHDFAFAVREAFEKANGGRIKVLLDEEYLTDAKDFRTYITKLRGLKGAHAVLALLMPGQLGVFAKQMRQQGVELPLFGFEFFEDPNEVKVSNGALIGQWYVNAASALPEFEKSYQARHPGASSFGAANGHDALLLLAAAIRTAGTPQEINAFLHTLKDFSGAMGTYSATPVNTFTLPAAIKVVHP
jgi:branched-chain amino acid transport system substrate-binding protein